MKTRIIGSLILILVLLGTYVATSTESTPTATQEQPATFNNDSSLKSLSIN